MASSGNTIALITELDVMTDALRSMMVIGEGDAPNAAQTTQGRRLLNNIVSEFRTFGMQSFLRSVYNLMLVTGQDTYEIGVAKTTAIPYPTYIYDMNLVMGPSFETEILLNQQAIYDFNQLPPDSTGTPVNYNYQPNINYGTLRIWPTPDASVPVSTYIKITYQRPIEVFNSSSDNMDFPQEWGNALTFALALVWSDSYGIPEAKKGWLEKQADRHLANALSITNEQGSLFFQKDWQGA